MGSDVSSKFRNPQLSLDERIEDLLSQLTLSEKFHLMIGYTSFTTYPIPRLGVGEFGMTDGPHGVGYHSAKATKNTYFPASIGLAASWNSDLAYKFGVALAQETRACDRHAILAPGFNICRTPLNGRTFEYLSEDPYLNGNVAAAIVKGVQSQRVAACIKHFLCNNQDNARKFTNSIVDERTLEEIYLKAFKIAVKTADPWLIMGAYNQVNGKYVYEDIDLLAKKVCGDWGFKNCIVSDWTATHYLRDPATCIKAKFSLEMPTPFVYSEQLLQAAYDQKRFTDDELNEVIRRLLRVMFLVGMFDPSESIPPGSRNTPEHREIARKMIEDGAVLLKNTNHLLPISIDKVKSICITGDMANYRRAPPFFGGSSAVVPPNSTSIKQSLLAKLGGQVKFVPSPGKADIVILVTGWSHFNFNDAEGQDRRSLILAKRKIRKIQSVAKQNKNTVVVLIGGGPCAMEGWLDQIGALLAVWQPHQECGNGVVNLLLGTANPSGKLPVTFPKKLEDSPVHCSRYSEKRTYPLRKFGLLDVLKYEGIYHRNSVGRKVPIIDIHYDEGIYVGYRHYEKFQIEPLFPFGFGLSYTTFDYSNLNVIGIPNIKAENFSLSVDITNTGSIAGAEVVQVYSSDLECYVDRPIKELIGFTKIFLQPGEKKRVTLDIPIEQLGFYDIKNHKWTVEPGNFKIQIGASSSDIRLEQIIHL